jgi:8-oxo-dGTP pyrophosphatase MutT (NUDIX family)
LGFVSALPDILAVPRVEIAIRAVPHVFAPADQAAIEASWHRRQATNPHLWNGAAFLFDQSAVAADGGFEAEGSLSDFASFLHLRDTGTLGHAYHHLFPVGALVTADRRLVIGEMSAKTANSGKFYPPSGSFDASDLVAGNLDCLGNIVREVVEEIGLDLDRSALTPNWVVMGSGVGRSAIVTVIQLDIPAAAVERIARAHLAEDPEEELADIVFVPLDARIDAARTVGYVNPLLAYLDAHLV